jgi:prepilin-type N-terminal cleavage/methylation domain-containing protein
MCGNIKLAPRARQGWTLVEMMVAVGIFSLVGMALMGSYIFAVKSMASMYSYALLDQYNRQTMDQLTREIRQSKNVLAFTTNSITILTSNDDGTDGPQVTYNFSPSAKKLIRSSSDGSAKLLLDNCSLLQFQLFTRCPSNVFGVFPVAVNNWSNTVKVLQLTWKTSIVQPNNIANSENIQTARIVIRKQQNS